jgi:uncharacterized protein (DUF1919 family)
MGTGILDVIGGPHDFLPPRSDGSDEFKKNCNFILVFKKHDVPDLYRSLHRIRFYLEFRLQFRQHGNVSIIKMWSFLKHYDRAQFEQSEELNDNMIERLHREINFSHFNQLL